MLLPPHLTPPGVEWRVHLAPASAQLVCLTRLPGLHEPNADEQHARPMPDPDTPQAHTQWAARKQRLETIKAEIASVLAGVSEEG
jgi:hypothetical protein